MNPALCWAMAFAIFIHRADSIYHDLPAEQYQFPAQYLSRAQPATGDWIVYYEPTKVRNSRGYFAVAKVERIILDPSTPGMYLAIIEPGSYLDFPNPVPYRGPEGVIEQGVLNERGINSGRSQAAVRPLAAQDFNRILELGLKEETPLMPRVNEVSPVLQDPALPFHFDAERSRLSYFTSRIVRDRLFRRVVLRAYEERCAVTGLKLINGGGRAEVEAAHVQPVEFNGPDSVRNGIALLGTAHWMFDRGLISLEDDLRILVSRQTNDYAGVRAFINESGYALPPRNISDSLHPQFLRWHREHCFKE